MPSPPKTYLILGATRGIGLELVRQVLALNHRVIATQRSPSASLKVLKESYPDSMRILNCDVSDETSITEFVRNVGALAENGEFLSHEGDRKGLINTVVFNAGILTHPARITEFSSQFLIHLQTNTLGPLSTASKLLAHPRLCFHNLVFISSDSGSMGRWLDHEDGFAAYGMSKCALNMGVRHLAAELARKSKGGEDGMGEGEGEGGGKREEKGVPVVMAVHPGEVRTDMASAVELDWVVEGQMEVEESVRGVLDVVERKGWGGVEEMGRGEAGFWDWNGEVHPW
ncbi:NAD(P)-binding Rossmann-fold containing protein [Glarea lozoyensis ATCC 20868]|uniref:NAD(P)-binding Rossmann-fold containing protein n=1 Tax=Glarea lozoyensis (strain ATCC 20868 / MF5171) TaxID=1116229 RepID=S3D2L6_GLAL2|nr:NAD(P)-binding Rossmann-fold containing protein [Glarea lozoyensis ATCC 20868]EPE31394.1 NAD(P)-binding Rossmann-fold containing protein [Glarea lozoyensis ATCC 20868]